MDLPPNSQLLPNNLLVDLGRKVRSAYGRLRHDARYDPMEAYLPTKVSSWAFFCEIGVSVMAKPLSDLLYSFGCFIK